jgi:hypothetical protein
VATDAAGHAAEQAVSLAITDVNEGPDPGFDNDGVPDGQEDAIPGLPSSSGGNALSGDGNGDGLRDSQQSNVTSILVLSTPDLHNGPGPMPSFYVTLVADARNGKIDTSDDNSATLSHIRQVGVPVDLLAAVEMPLAMIGFSTDVGFSGAAGVGVAETFSLYIDASLHVDGYWQQDIAGTWVNLASVAYGGQIVNEGGRLRLDFQIVDGGEFDADHEVNGSIVALGAAAFVPLSLVGYVTDLPADAFWF